MPQKLPITSAVLDPYVSNHSLALRTEMLDLAPHVANSDYDIRWVQARSVTLGRHVRGFAQNFGFVHSTASTLSYQDGILNKAN